MIYDGGPAFPRPLSTDDHNNPCNTSMDQAGMSLRDWFAGQIILGLMASTAHPRSRGPGMMTWPEWAEDAYAAADAMLKESQRSGEK